MVRYQVPQPSLVDGIRKANHSYSSSERGRLLILNPVEFGVPAENKHRRAGMENPIEDLARLGSDRWTFNFLDM